MASHRANAEASCENGVHSRNPSAKPPVSEAVIMKNMMKIGPDDLSAAAAIAFLPAIFHQK
ncbi:Uncharacterised protein [Mycobacteroides abscessus subsp. abscessus]|nr:Uncharacterised protein [Mycobacteroides abscessus subsp. abscessus]